MKFFGLLYTIRVVQTLVMKMKLNIELKFDFPQEVIHFHLKKELVDRDLNKKQIVKGSICETKLNIVNTLNVDMLK